MKTTTQTFAFLVLCFSLFFAGNSYCQLRNLGIKGGLNLSNINLDNKTLDDYPKNRSGFNVDLFYDFLNLKNVALSAEAGYSQKGYKSETINYDMNGNTTGTENISYSLNYIETSVLGKFFLNTKYVNPYLSLGPVWGFYTGYSVSSDGPNIDLYKNNVVLEDLKPQVLGLLIGAGSELKNILPVLLIIEIRYNLDLTNSFSNGNIKFSNKLLEFNLGIKL
jgi:Outer membrane protein beta-barrel domain